MIRAFVGLPVPPESAAVLEVVQADLPVGRAVPVENFHVTLAFLGEHPVPVIEDVHLALADLTVPEVPLALSGIGLFGTTARPRVIFAAVAVTPALGQLRAKVVQAARGAGIALARSRFRPHVTLARSAGGLGMDETARLERFLSHHVGLTAPAEPVSRFALYESRLGRAGAVYSELATYPLAAHTAA